MFQESTISTMITNVLSLVLMDTMDKKPTTPVSLVIMVVLIALDLTLLNAMVVDLILQSHLLITTTSTMAPPSAILHVHMVNTQSTHHLLAKTVT